MRHIFLIFVFFALAVPAYAESTVSIELWTAQWCSECPAAKKVAKELEDKGYKVEYKDFDKNKDEADKKGISVLPTAIIIVNEVTYLKLVGSEFTVQRIVEIPVSEPDEPEPDKPEPYEPDYNLTEER